MERVRAVSSWASILVGTLVAGFASAPQTSLAAERLPNVVLVYCDDLAYADVACFRDTGATGVPTPHLDRLAKDGIKFTDFYVAQAVCSASRTALLTGCYPNRVGIQGALGPASKIGIHASETTLGELFQSRGYQTACFGKWHLGHLPQFLPEQNGFHRYYGLPYSNDMWPKHPEVGKSFPALPLIEGSQTIALNPDQRLLTTTYTAKACDFIREHKAQPFFVYVPHTMPHVPLFVSLEGEGQSGAGLFGDVIREIDESVGRIVATLEEQGLTDQTLVIFSSDNGPWLSYGDHAGSAGPLREGKGTTWDGGVRVPFVAKWPGKIPAGATCTEPAMTIDLLPTLAKLIGAELPKHKIDGLDIGPLLTGEPGATSPHDALFFYWGEGLEAVRAGPWKLHFPHDYRTLAGVPKATGGIPAKYKQAKTPLALYNLSTDRGEANDLAAQHPDVVAKLTHLAQAMRTDLGDTLTKTPGTGHREPGRAP
jgi:arylsulfatase A